MTCSVYEVVVTSLIHGFILPCQVPDLLPVQTQTQAGVLLENTMPTSMMVSCLTWAVSGERSADSVEESAQSFKGLISSVISRATRPLNFTISPVGGNGQLHTVLLTDAGHFPREAPASFFATEATPELEKIYEAWQSLLATWAHYAMSVSEDCMLRVV